MADKPHKADLADVFANMDSDGDGRISRDELRRVFAALGMPVPEATLVELLRAFDLDRDGGLDFEEVAALLKRSPPGDRDDIELRHAFNLCDLDGDGFIDRTELERSMQIVGQVLTGEQLDVMLDAADSDSDGRVSFEEFAAMLES